LARRHLDLKPIDPKQFDRLDRLPARPPDLVPLDSADPIAALLEKPEFSDLPTGSIAKPRPKKGKP
jgi:hypothetical protein